MVDQSQLNERYTLILNGALVYAPKADKFSNPDILAARYIMFSPVEDKTDAQHFQDQTSGTSLGNVYAHNFRLGMFYIPMNASVLETEFETPLTIEEFDNGSE